MTALIWPAWADERGQAMVLVALFLPALLAVSGLVADGGWLFAQRRDLQNAADAAAVAGAMALDEGAYRASGGAATRLDPARARALALASLAGESLTRSVRASEAQVEVELSREARTLFLGALGVSAVEIRASARAGPRAGVRAGGR